MNRPGITPETLNRAGIRAVGEAEAENLIGMKAPGLAIPYSDLGDRPLIVNDRHFHRIRLAEPKGSAKYLSPKDSGSQLYIPKNQEPAGTTLVVTEGEFKALALAEAGILAVGLGGITSALNARKLIPALADCLKVWKIETVAFLGDADTALIYDFSREATKMRAALPKGVKLILPRVPFDAPKGIDDCREELGAGFPGWWAEIMESALEVPEKYPDSSLALRLVIPCLPVIAKDFDAHQGRLMKLAGSLDAVTMERLAREVKAVTGTTTTAFKKAVEEGESPVREGRFVPTEEDLIVPVEVFPVPAGEHGYVVCANVIFPVVAKSMQWFTRAGKVHEIQSDRDGARLVPMEKERAVSVLETFAKNNKKRIARFEVKDDTFYWRTRTMPTGSMDILLRTDAAREHLPEIRQLVSCPVLVEVAKARCEVLTAGYHAHGGGTYITKGETPPIVQLDTAIEALLGIHADFAFCSPADLSRAIAVMLTPAMKMGGFIQDDYPIHIAEAVESQSGKDYMHKAHSRIYNERPAGIAPCKGGVGSLDETISKTLIYGRPFICLANFRGKLESAILEEAIRGQGRVECRALRTAATVDCTPFIWQLSTNGAEFTRDLANRSIITRIRKQPPDYRFKEYPEGALIAHIEANQPFYLGCVFAVVREWVACYKPRTKDTRHDFRTWTQVMDWIVQKMFRLAPLLDGHREEQARTANPALQWLRDVANAAIRQGRAGKQLIALDIADICDDAEIDLPGRKESSEEPKFKIGRTLGSLFKDADQIDPATARLIVDGITITKVTAKEYDRARREERERHHYVFEKDSAPCAPCAPCRGERHETATEKCEVPTEIPLFRSDFGNLPPPRGTRGTATSIAADSDKQRSSIPGNAGTEPTATEVVTETSRVAEEPAPQTPAVVPDKPEIHVKLTVEGAALVRRVLATKMSVDDKTVIMRIAARHEVPVEIMARASLCCALEDFAKHFDPPYEFMTLLASLAKNFGHETNDSMANSLLGVPHTPLERHFQDAVSIPPEGGSFILAPKSPRRSKRGLPK